MVLSMAPSSEKKNWQSTKPEDDGPRWGVMDASPRRLGDAHQNRTQMDVSSAQGHYPDIELIGFVFAACS